MSKFTDCSRTSHAMFIFGNHLTLLNDVKYDIYHDAAMLNIVRSIVRAMK